MLELFPLIPIWKKKSLVVNPTFFNQFYCSVSGHSAHRNEEQQLQLTVSSSTISYCSCGLISITSVMNVTIIFTDDSQICLI